MWRIVLVATAVVSLASAYDKCPFPGSPAHCEVRFSNETLAAGTVAVYQCERGFELLGPERRICEHGVWLPEGVPFCVLNVAAGKAPMQISTAAGGLPQKAIDGSTSSFFAGDTCTLTKTERTPWWYVNLLEPYMVQLVRLDFGKSCCGPQKPATVTVRVGNNRPDLGTNPVCNRFTGELEEGKPLFLPCNPPLPGAFVSVHLDGPNPTQLSLCEAFVYTDQALPIERCPQFRDQPPGSTATYNGKCYIFYSRQPRNFRDALAFCRSRGGDLVAESNPALQGFISWELWRRHRSDTASQYWMGAVRDPKDRNNWKWVGGSDVTLSFWNLPGGNEDCARYDGSKGWLWSDTNCNQPINYICQHQPKACGKPEQPANSTMVARDFNVGTTIEYSCDEGHLLVGPATRTCLSTGFYDEFPPVCKSIQCGYPADISHGSYQLVNNSVAYLSRVLYSCQPGYRLVGRGLLTCDIDERWNGPPPKCQRVECPIPAAIANGRVVLTDNNTYVGSTADYGCASRSYRLVGPKLLTCLPTGRWDQDPPVCEEESVVIPPIPPASTPSRSAAPSTPAIVQPTTSRPRPAVRPPSPSPPAVTRAPTTPSPRPATLPPFSRPRPGPFTPPPPRTSSVVPDIEDDLDEESLPEGVNDLPEQRRPGQDSQPSGAAHVPRIVVASNQPPQPSDAPDGANIRTGGANVELPGVAIDTDKKDTLSARLNMGAIIALGVFGGFVFLAAMITTIVILIRRNRSAKHYRHRASPDCNTVASYDSSSSESRGGLNRYYRQAWENLHQATGGKAAACAAASAHHSALRRKETMDEPMGYRREGLRDGSELVVSDSYPAPRQNGNGNSVAAAAAAAAAVAAEKKRHHHHHHHGHGVSGNGAPGPQDWRHQHGRQQHRNRY